MGVVPSGLPQEGGYKSPSITHLWPHHRSMARLFVEGGKPSEIARITGFSLGQISRILGSPAFQLELNRLAEDADTAAVEANKILLEHAPRAATVLVEDLYQTPSEGEDGLKVRASRQQAAKDVLDRTGHGRAAVLPPSVPSVSLTQINIKQKSTPDLFAEVMEMMD